MSRWLRTSAGECRVMTEAAHARYERQFTDVAMAARYRELFERMG